MLIQFLAPSPKAGLREHVSREIGAMLITAGFAVECDPAVPHPQNIPRNVPPAGFVVCRGFDGSTLEIRENDGCGGFLIHEVDPKTKKLKGFYRWDPGQQRRVLVVPDCPQEVLDTYFTLKGAPSPRRQIEEAERAQRRQDGRA